MKILRIACLLALVGLLFFPTVPYWAVRREYYRWQWSQRQVNVGQFFAALGGQPEWMDKSTIPFYRYWSQSARMVRAVQEMDR